MVVVDPVCNAPHQMGTHPVNVAVHQQALEYRLEPASTDFHPTSANSLKAGLQQTNTFMEISPDSPHRAFSCTIPSQRR